jgi:hypothetical protein
VPYLGLNFENQTERVILPEFTSDPAAYAANREWQRDIDEGHFRKGLTLFCQCEGEYFIRADTKLFRITSAKYYFAKFKGWDQKLMGLT